MHLYSLRDNEAGLWAAMPVPQASTVIPKTPRCMLTLHALDLRVQTGVISPTLSARKVRKGLEDVHAQLVVLERDLEFQDAAVQQDQEAGNHGKRTRYPLGRVFDQQYPETHAEELAAQKEEEEARERMRMTKSHAVPHAELSNSAQRKIEAATMD